MNNWRSQRSSHDGSLYSLLHTNKNELLTWDKRKEIAQKVSLSLAFLHKSGMVYGNVNSSNVMLDHLGRASLTAPCLEEDVENSSNVILDHLGRASLTDSCLEEDVENSSFEEDVENSSNIMLDCLGRASLGDLCLEEDVENSFLEEDVENSSNIMLDHLGRASLGNLCLEEDVENSSLEEDVENSSNLMLDHLERASLTDPCLEEDVENSDSGLVEGSNSGVVGLEKFSSGSWGFMAPKQFYSGKTSKESDVYSFGVLLLELLTGKDPLTASSHLPKLIFSINDERWPMEMLDRELGSDIDIPKMWAMYRIAKQCTSLHEHCRPGMGQVVKRITNVSKMSNESTENGVFDEDWASLENEIPINDEYVQMLVNRPDLQD